VIVDTPPLLAVGDAMTLSAKAGGIVVVTRLNFVDRPMLSELKRQLEAAPAPKLGYVVTGSGDDDAVGYAYGSPYGYPYGGAETADRRAPKENAQPRSVVTVEEVERH
jgi:Mrp family chromosome partitioning ATPase